ncbi:MAG: DUF72 domain-containing protein [Xanthomonadales bacterium]|nr:DUF72 domain-containing protein [Xanthomonadales bacterium]
MSNAQPHESLPAMGSIRVGIGGWNYAPWRDNFYPRKWPQRRELEYASRQLDTIEINSTFYRAPAPAIYAKWRDETPEGFIFALKAPRYLTDRNRLADAGRSIAGFIDGGLAELGDRLGPINWQLPLGLRFDPDDLARFLDLLPSQTGGLRLRHALEVRHPGFACEAYLELARSRGIATVFTDSPKQPSFADATGGFIYARLKGSVSPIPQGYAAEALDQWAARARIWARGADPSDLPHVGVVPKGSTKARDAFIYFIGAAKERNPAAAMVLAANLRSADNEM